MLEALFSGRSGMVLGVVSQVALVFVSFYSMLRFLGVLLLPPKTHYSLTLFLWAIFALVLWLVVAHTSLGERRYGRILAGMSVLVILFFVLETYILGWISAIAYWPIMNMNLRDFGVTDMSPYAFGTFIFTGVLIFAGFAFFVWELLHSQSFWSEYFTWRLKFMNNNMAEQREEKLDIVVCIDAETEKPVVIPEDDLTLNTAIQGPTGGGKTSQVLAPILGQILVNSRAGATVVEPKGSFALMAFEMAKQAGKTYCKFIDPTNPDTDILNPLEGEDPDLVAAINDAMLQTLFGEQDAFFQKNQSVVAKNIILLLKYLRGNDLTYDDVNDLLLDPGLCKSMVETLRGRLPQNEPQHSPRRKLILWFDKEMFGENAAKIREFSLGLRIQISELLSNKYFTRCINGKSTIDMDKLLAEGGFLAVSTHDGYLKKLSKALGMVVLGHLQAAVERRPLPRNPIDPAQKLRPHVIMIDEFAGYVNEDFGMFMSKVREYNAPLFLAFQARSQMEEVGRGNNRAFREKVISLCRSKLWFPDVPQEDAKWYSELSGKFEVEEVSKSSGTSTGAMSWFMPDSYRESESTRLTEKPKYTYTEILQGKAGTIFYRVMQNRTATETGVGLVDFFDRDKSSIGDAYWFDRKEFERVLAQKGQNKVENTGGLKGVLERLGIARERSIKDEINAAEYMPSDKRLPWLEGRDEVNDTALEVPTIEDFAFRTLPPDIETEVSNKEVRLRVQEKGRKEGDLPQTHVSEKLITEELLKERYVTEKEDRGEEVPIQERNEKIVEKVNTSVELPPLNDTVNWATSADDLL